MNIIKETPITFMSLCMWLILWIESNILTWGTNSIIPWLFILGLVPVIGLIGAWEIFR